MIQLYRAFTLTFAPLYPFCGYLIHLLVHEPRRTRPLAALDVNTAVTCDMVGCAENVRGGGRITVDFVELALFPPPPLLFFFFLSLEQRCDGPLTTVKIPPRRPKLQNIFGM